MLDAVARIDEYLNGKTQREFMAASLLQDAVIRNLEIIGEAARNIVRRDPEFVAGHPELTLTAAYEMRNVLAHGYFAVDLDVVWQTIRHDLPALKAGIARILKQI